MKDSTNNKYGIDEVGSTHDEWANVTRDTVRHVVASELDTLNIPKAPDNLGVSGGTSVPVSDNSDLVSRTIRFILLGVSQGTKTQQIVDIANNEAYSIIKTDRVVSEEYKRLDGCVEIILELEGSPLYLKDVEVNMKYQMNKISTSVSVGYKR